MPSVIVVGAGPAGSTAARLLAERGARVTLLEACRLPRPKLCGGGLTPKALRLLPTVALATVERLVDAVELRGGRASPLRIRRPEATIAMVERARFDHALVEAAAAAGAEVRDGEAVLEVAVDADGAHIVTTRGSIHGNVLVAADGEPSRVAHRLGLASPPSRIALALEVDLPFSATLPPGTAIVSLSVPGGYAWYFPKRDHASVGVASARPGHYRELRSDLARFARGLDLAIENDRVRGHYIPVGLRTGPLAGARVVLVGDAAATVDPLFGEGIAYAVHSAGVAARTVEDWAAGRVPDLRAYDARLRATLAPAFGRLDMIARMVDVSATAVLLALRTSEAARDVGVDAVAGRRAPFALATP